MGTSRFASLTLVCALLVSAPVAAQGKKTKPRSTADSGQKNSSQPEDAPADNGGMCISPDAPRTVGECPSNMGKAKGKIAGPDPSAIFDCVM